MSENAQWYAIHTYSGYENKVAEDLKRIIEVRSLEDMIQDVRIPTETVVEKTEKGEKEYERKLFPSYVLVKMIMDNDMWFIVRNTRGVTGFVGATTTPIPLSMEEVRKFGVDQNDENAEQRKVAKHEFSVGDNVQIVDGSYEGYFGIVEEIYTDTAKLKVMVSMFGRETPIEIAQEQVALVKD